MPFELSLEIRFEIRIEIPFEIPPKIEKLIELRETARAENNWTLADSLRDQIRAEGWAVEDTTKGQKVKKTSY